jgi:hypothetical protein
MNADEPKIEAKEAAPRAKDKAAPAMPEAKAPEVKAKSARQGSFRNKILCNTSPACNDFSDVRRVFGSAIQNNGVHNGPWLTQNNNRRSIRCSKHCSAVS